MLPHDRTQYLGKAIALWDDYDLILALIFPVLLSQGDRPFHPSLQKRDRTVGYKEKRSLELLFSLHGATSPLNLVH